MRKIWILIFFSLSSTIIRYLFVRGYSCYLTRWYIKLIVSVVIYIDISHFLGYIEGWKPDCFSFPPDFMLPMMKTICLHPTPNSALALDLMRIMLIIFFSLCSYYLSKYFPGLITLVHMEKGSCSTFLMCLHIIWFVPLLDGDPSSSNYLKIPITIYTMFCVKTVLIFLLWLLCFFLSWTTDEG